MPFDSMGVVPIVGLAWGCRVRFERVGVVYLGIFNAVVCSQVGRLLPYI